MMTKWISVVLALVALSACSSAPVTRYYQLPTAGSGVIVNSQRVDRPIWVEHVSIPDYLAGSGMVYQSNDVQYVIAVNNLWASPLGQQLEQTLVSNLSAELPGALISATPLDQQHDTLNVVINSFQGRYDGYAVISGEWTLGHDGKFSKQTFTLTLPQPEDGYDALVRMLAQGWQQVSVQMANAIISQH